MLESEYNQLIEDMRDIVRKLGQIDLKSLGDHIKMTEENFQKYEGTEEQKEVTKLAS